jgi:NitT/TauT family transport system permease protein
MRIAQLRFALYPLIGFALLVAVWQAYVDLFKVNPIVLPSPLRILDAMAQNFPLLLHEAWPSFLESALGFALALAIGVPMAIAVANSRILNLTLYPIFVATQSIPKVAVAPIILVWFGVGLNSKLAIAFLVAFFPIVVDTATGLAATPQGLLELARSLRATPAQIFWKVQLPAALPHIFAGSKVAVTLAVVGAVIGEFVGSNAGLGNLLLSANSQLDSPLAWAALAWLSLLGILLFLAVALVERLVMPWANLATH